MPSFEQKLARLQTSTPESSVNASSRGVDRPVVPNTSLTPSELIPLQGTGYDRRAPGDRIKTGVVLDVNVGEGTCRVQTRSGEVLDRVRPTSMGGGSAGTGMIGLPSPQTRCIVLKTGEMFSDNVLIGTFPPLDPEDSKTQVGPAKEVLPGMVAHHFEDGGRFLLSPSGMVDIKAHPWAHRTYVPSEHLIREHVRQFSQKSGPHDLFRRISSTEEENSFL